MEKCEIIGNKNQFTQIIINILNNAKDAIVLNNSKDRYIFVKLYCDNKKIILNIKDSGGGIIDEMKDKLFEPYTTSKHKSVGTGIGLYMSYKLLTQAYNAIIEANNVEYEYEGKTLKGAEFKITLPLDIA